MGKLVFFARGNNFVGLDFKLVGLARVLGELAVRLDSTFGGLEGQLVVAFDDDLHGALLGVLDLPKLELAGAPAWGCTLRGPAGGGNLDGFALGRELLDALAFALA